MSATDPERTPSQQESSEGLTRREFLQAAGGVIVSFAVSGVGGVFAAAGQPSTVDPNAWLRIGRDGRITVFAPIPETGQGLRTQLAQLVAEELSTSLTSVEVVLGDTDRVPVYEITCASEVLPTAGVRVRQAAAQAREVLASLAAEKWSVSRSAVAVKSGGVELVSDPTRKLGFGELAGGKPLLRRLKDSAALKPAKAYSTVGTSAGRVEGLSYVTGKARYAADYRPKDLLYGSVLRRPYLGARLERADARASVGQPGVVAVVKEGGFVGVVATRPDLSERALKLVQASWVGGRQASAASLYQDLRQKAVLAEELSHRGEVESALAGARHGFSANYRTPYAAHAPLEPEAALAQMEDGGLVVRASTRQPFVQRQAVAAALGVPETKVRVMATTIGGAFGGKESPSLSIAAARLAQAVGRPVLVQHRREEEMCGTTFRPAGLMSVQCGVTGEGRITAWAYDVFNCGGRGARPPYGFPHERIRSYACESPLPQGSWRTQGGLPNAFAREVHLDHVASELQEDPVALRLRHLDGSPPMKHVVRRAAERCGWRDRRPPTGLGVGFACATDAGSYAAVVAEVEVDRVSGHVRVRRVSVVQDSGLVINPEIVHSQIAGGVVMGLGSALWEAVRYEQGRILTKSFASYPIPTFRDTPELDIELVASDSQVPQGPGTAALCAVVPAVVNAVFDATGQRLRELPLSPARLRSGA
ncbi:MAG: molybdopterin-dependent oxidoreductase [Armatimonadetes bacterium]|nr:molybdopterin-dependent oxidoreductase [Armatimonadota bacterium]